MLELGLVIMRAIGSMGGQINVLAPYVTVVIVATMQETKTKESYTWMPLYKILQNYISWILNQVDTRN